MRRILMVLAGSSVLLAATSTWACVPDPFSPVHALARVKDAQGTWRKIAIDADRYNMRLEYDDPSKAGVRWAIAGDWLQGKVYRFPVRWTGGRRPKAQLADFEQATGQLGIDFRLVSMNFVGRSTRWFDGRFTTYKSLPCGYAIKNNVGIDGRHKPSDYDLNYCAHATGLPVFIKDSQGALQYEILSLKQGPISASLFKPPAHTVLAQGRAIGCS